MSSQVDADPELMVSPGYSVVLLVAAVSLAGSRAVCTDTSMLVIQTSNNGQATTAESFWSYHAELCKLKRASWKRQLCSSASTSSSDGSVAGQVLHILIRALSL